MYRWIIAQRNKIIFTEYKDTIKAGLLETFFEITYLEIFFFYTESRLRKLTGDRRYVSIGVGAADNRIAGYQEHFELGQERTAFVERTIIDYIQFI